MGYMKHHAIVITSSNKKHIEKSRVKSLEIFQNYFEKDLISSDGTRMVSEIISGVINSQYTFMIAPDGSKEGWGTSDIGDNARDNLLDWMDESDLYIDYVLVKFGGDDSENRIERAT